MTRTKSTYLALLAVLLAPMAANADVLYQFSFLDIDQGGTNTVMGTIALPDLCGTNCTGAAALSVVLDAAPFGPIGFDFLGAATQLSNSFDTVAGVVTFANFDAWDSSGSIFELVLSQGFAGFQFLGDFSTVATDGWTGTGGDGSSLIITRVSEPGTLALLSLGLLGLGLSRRKKA